MEKAKAIDLLKQAIADEIPRLKGLRYDSREFKLWRSKIETIIKTGLDPDDTQTFSRAVTSFKTRGLWSDIDYQEEYLENLPKYETAILSIIQKYEILGTEPERAIEIKTPLKAFISHGKGGGALLKLEKFIKELGVEPIIVKDQPSADRTVDDKVIDYLNEADFVVIFATGDDEIKVKGRDKGIFQPRQNVIHEIGLAQKTHPGKIIYLLEERAQFPSNIDPKVYERFARQSMDDAFTAIVRELKHWGFLKVGKEE